MMKHFSQIFLAMLVCVFFTFSNVDACSRITFATNEGTVVTGRSMDWIDTDNPIMVVFKRGVERKSISSNPITWKSKYGSIAITSNGKNASFINSGMNEKGLAVDFLWLGETKFPKKQKEKTTIGVTEQLQYILDNFSTVEEVVNFVNNKNIVVEMTNKDKISGTELLVHYIVTDVKGNNVIVEFINEKPVVYQIKGTAVITNDPSYDKMLAIKDYYTEAGIMSTLPGTPLAQARFVFLTGWLTQFSNKVLPQYVGKSKTFDQQTVLSVLSLMRGVSTPLGIVLDKARPNNTSTVWRTVCDLKNKKFYFESALNLSTVWVDLKKVNFKNDYSLSLNGNDKIFGDITSKFQK